MNAPVRSDARLGSLLVALQFVLLAWLGFKGVAGLLLARLPIDAVIAAGVSLALGLWALSANRLGNFNIRPLPREGGRLIEHGPYRWIRHPMYTALLLAGVAAARFASDLETWLVLAALGAVLLTKARVEERAMSERHPSYRDYQQRTWRFVPGLY
jgi:protein-S-isoprenylcysteine O-methyltransferase Ste14